MRKVSAAHEKGRQTEVNPASHIESRLPFPSFSAGSDASRYALILFS